jgi:hypothetical protein
LMVPAWLVDENGKLIISAKLGSDRFQHLGG